MEELLSLKWNNHRTTFLHILAVLRDKQLYTDATLACDGKIYPVHKLVLSTCSDYFSAMLDRTSCKNPIIVLKDIKSEDLEALLDYMYLGEVNVRQSDLSTLIKAAECLRVKGLAVADDEPPPRKSRTSDNQTRRGDTSGSPPAKRKRRSDVDDGRDDVRPGRIENRHASPVHNSTPSRPKTPSNSHSSSTPTRNNSTNSHSNSASNNNVNSTSISNSTSNNKLCSDGSTATNANNEVLEPTPYVKVEMEEDEQDRMSGGGGDCSNALGDNAGDSNTGDMGDNFNLNSEDFKEEDDNDGGDLGTDLPEFLQQATTNYSHSSFAGTSFQPDLSWQGSGDSGGGGSGLAGSFGATAGLSFGGSQQQDGTSHGSAAGGSATVECPVCGKQLSGRNGKQKLKYHMLTHTGEKPFHCPHCPYRAALKFNLVSHVKNIHKQSPPLTGSDRSIYQSPPHGGAPPPHTLRPGGGGMLQPSLPTSLHQRLLQHHSSSAQQLMSLTLGRSLEYASSLLESAGVTVASGDNTSSRSRSPTPSDQPRPMGDEGRDISEGDFSGGGPLCCSVCGKVITGRNRRQRLQYHLLTHSGERNHSCPYCPYKALLKFTLDRHIRGVHKHVFSVGGADSTAMIPSSSVGLVAADTCSHELPGVGQHVLSSKFGGTSLFGQQMLHRERGSLQPASVSFGRISSGDEIRSSASTQFVQNVSSSGRTDAFPRPLHDFAGVSASEIIDVSLPLASPKASYDFSKPS